MTSMIAMLVVVVLLPQVVMAREDYCLDPNTKQIDQKATDAYRLLDSQSNQAIMDKLSGTWLSTTTSPATNQVSYLYESFTRLGIYDYTNYVCTLQNTFCSRYDGTGLYAVRANGTNKFFGVKIVSDAIGRDHACLGLQGKFVNKNTIVSGKTRLKRYSKARMVR
ncbi:hypothetical protein [Methylocucumis oryzae]|uniref:Uncharacterized protein n=1 Tax=Methylocucumis oryzae TaxID=1632867 RepID=A0A0F3IKR0_9GAMM|nr:hypothetical protein [Methylocucumis oryzae]KJV07306.1 hypothetical protein VZ94_05580 [Methylocucumis oryzae]